MKKNIISVFLLSLCCFCSCVREEGLKTDSGKVDPLTRAGFICLQVTDEHTDDIKAIRFFVFTDLDLYPKAEENDYRVIPDSEADRASALQAVFEVSMTDKLVVTIINEPDTLTNILNNITTLRELENLELKMASIVTSDHFSMKTGVMMPMSGAVWTNKNHVQATAENAKANQQIIALSRLLARVDIYLTTDITGGLEILPESYIELKNTYTKSRFIHHMDENGNELGRIQTVQTGELTKSRWLIDDPNAGGNPPTSGTGSGESAGTIMPVQENQNMYICSFYTPERTCLTDKLIIDFSLKTTDGDKNASISLDKMHNDEGDPLPIDVVRRNNRYIVRGNIRKTVEITPEIGIEVMKWNEGLEPFLLGQYFLTVDKSYLAFPYTGGTQTIAISTNHPDSWVIGNPVNLANEITATAGAGAVEVNARLRDELNSPATAGWFTLRAGNLNKSIFVTQAMSELTHVNNGLPTTTAIPSEGGNYAVTANTNLVQGWKVKVYSDSNTLVAETDIRCPSDGQTSVNDANSVTIPSFAGPDSRELHFYLHSPEYPNKEIHFATKIQGAPQPVLEHRRNTMPANMTIPAERDSYTVTAYTNLQDWKLRVHDSKTNLYIIDQTGSPNETISLNSHGEYSTQASVGENPYTAERTLTFSLYSPSRGITVPVGAWTQPAKFIPYPEVEGALLTPPGVLGVSESGELTLRGSREYAGTAIEANAGFGAVHEETVYIAYFKYGSNIALSAKDDGVFSSNEVIRAPEGKRSGYDRLTHRCRRLGTNPYP